MIDIKTFNPMLACEVKLEEVKFPCYVSPKIDGCRWANFPSPLYRRNFPATIKSIGIVESNFAKITLAFAPNFLSHQNHNS